MGSEEGTRYSWVVSVAVVLEIRLSTTWVKTL